jgi:circadian clock protein KaiB
MSDLPEKKEVGVAGGAEGAKMAAPDDPVAYVLSLYVAGSTPRSLRAIANTRALCEEFLPGQYALEVIDIYQQPALAEEAELIAIPMLIKKSPLPLRRFVGDMSDTGLILTGMGVKPR